MKIELSVDSHQLSSEVSDLVKNLGPEQKQELAKHLLAQAFLDVNGNLDKAYMEGKALEEIRLSEKKPELSIEEAKRGWQWDRKVSELRKIRGELVHSIVSETVRDAKAKITEEIKNDPKIQAVIAETLTLIKEQFPVYVKDAMTMYLASQMKSQMEQVSMALATSSNVDGFVRNLDQRLINKGI